MLVFEVSAINQTYVPQLN